MHVSFDQLGQSGRAAPAIRVSFPTPPPAAAVEPSASRYGEGRRPNPLALATILAAHAALIAALATFEMIPVQRAREAPLVVTLVPEPVAPPPAGATPPEPEPAPLEPEQPRLVAPPPVVRLAAAPAIPAPPPPPVMVQAPAPPVAVAVAPAAPPAPTTPPDASAASLRNPAPRYPLESRRKREEGTVRLRVLITPEGRVKEIAVAGSSGFERLDEAALETVRRWKFLPGTRAGEPIEAVGFLNIPFRLSA